MLFIVLEDTFLAYSVDTCDVVTMPKGKAYTPKEVINIIFNDEESDKEFEPDDNESLLVMDESNNEDIRGLEPAPTLDAPSNSSGGPHGRSRSEYSWRSRGRRRSQRRGRAASIAEPQAPPESDNEPEDQNQDPKFPWQYYCNTDNFESDWLPDSTSHTGVLIDTANFTPFQYFKLFFLDEAFELI
ncbi:uncharacterized protein LOC143253311 [Tachypleus tridentatus]|uniref:uncharacterized protein LOC143253311 n=1 Tax=Tachypleus tridentatus TaxID=6853 RepID=UPI003FD131F6